MFNISIPIVIFILLSSYMINNLYLKISYNTLIKQKYYFNIRKEYRKASQKGNRLKTNK